MTNETTQTDAQTEFKMDVPLDIVQKVRAIKKAQEDVETLLSRIGNALLIAYGVVRPHSYFLRDYTVVLSDQILLKMEDVRDREQRAYTIPAEVINEGRVEEHCADLKREQGRLALDMLKAAEQAELKAAEDKVARLRAKLGITGGQGEGGPMTVGDRVTLKALPGTAYVVLEVKANRVYVQSEDLLGGHWYDLDEVEPAV